MERVVLIAVFVGTDVEDELAFDRALLERKELHRF